AAWRRYGIDIGVTARAQAVARIQSRPQAIQTQLLAALHECLYLTLRENNGPLREWVEEVLTEVDADPWRNAVRRSARTEGRETLMKLGRTANVSEQPVNFLITLAVSLTRDAGPTSLELLRRIQEVHPGDFWATHSLAIALLTQGRPHEAIRYFTAALALRSDNAGAYLNRALASLDAGELEAAHTDLQRAIALAPQLAEAHATLSRTLRARGQLEAAISACKEALSINPKLAIAHY